jgi:predicted amidohydrolase YtcJ
MNDPEQPTWGSWAGRYGLNSDSFGRQYFWANQVDAWKGTTSRDNTLRRWAVDLQNDFRARLNWCVKSYREANHPPLPVLNGLQGKEILQLETTPSATVSLSATGSSDPDRNQLRYEWFVYPEAATYRGKVTLKKTDGAETSVEIPADAGGKSIHVILTVRDLGWPSLARYRRAVLNVSAAAGNAENSELGTRNSERRAAAAAPDLIVHHGRIVTVDKPFSIREAMAIQGNKILQVGTDDEVLKTKGPRTELLDLQGKMVLPGLIDSHTHPTGAAMFEFDHPVPDMETIQDVLDYIKSRARVVPEGQWIVVQQVFITRLKEQRYPTRAELDAAAPKHPVAFRTGPDASVNTLALTRNGIDRNFKLPDGVAGKIEKDAKGDPTGILRNAGNYFKSESTEKSAKDEDYRQQLIALFKDYNSVGLTSIGDRSSSTDAIERFRKLRDAGELTVRIAVSQNIGTLGPIEDIQKKIREVARNPLCQGDDLLRIIGIKTFLDGGMLTGSAYMREPWGVSKIYSIDDPAYRGVLFIPRERLLPIVRTTVEAGLQFTAHSVGDGAVHTLLDVYEELSKEGLPVRQTRGCVTHSNFMSREAVEQAARLGVVLDIQPIWLYLDTRTLVNQFGYERLRYFQPLRSIFQAGGIVGGGSDHMQKIGSFRSINPYNPFLGMQTSITRRAKWYDGQLHPEEALTREQAIRFYTINNAYLLFKEDKIGSLESGKLADFIVLDTDLLTCPEARIAATQVLRTYVGGKLVYQREQP